VYPIDVATTVAIYGDTPILLNKSIKGISKSAFVIIPINEFLYITLNFCIP
jgi:hypothetical protein